MNVKTPITAILLLFVLGSIAAILIKESGFSSKSVQQTDVVPVAAESSASNAIEPATQRKSTGHQVIAYYFHGTARCVTCRTIEAFAQEAVESGFSNEIQSGHLVWKAINVEEPENRHFVDDYQLHTKSVVLVEHQDGQQIQWKNLDQVWNLVQNKEKFVAYVQEEAAKFLGNG